MKVFGWALFYIVIIVVVCLAYLKLFETTHNWLHEVSPPPVAIGKALESCKDRCNHECSGEQVLDCLLACGRCEPHLCGQCDARKEVGAVLESCASRCKNECPPAAWPSCLVGCHTGCEPHKCGNCNHL